MYYGYNSERRTVNGKTGSVLAPSEQAESVRIAFSMYQQPECYLKDIIEFFKENEVVTQRTGAYKSMGSINQSHVSLKERTKTWRYLIDFGFSTAHGCRKRTLKTKLDDVEEAVYIAMCDKIKSLEVARHEEDTPDAETESLKAEVLKYDDDIHKLMDKLPDADEVLFAYIQKRIKEFHKAKSKLESKL